MNLITISVTHLCGPYQYIVEDFKLFALLKFPIPKRSFSK